MHLFGPIDWWELFTPDTPLLEIFVRGTVTYLSIFLLLRIVLKRQSGAVATTDLLVVVLIADAAQNAMADNYNSIVDGLLLVAVIVAWSYALDWLGYHFRPIQRLVHPPSLLLVKDGKLLRHNMYKELITEGELMSQLREQGIDSIQAVREALIEGDGRISVIPREGANTTGGEHDRRLS